MGLIGEIFTQIKAEEGFKIVIKNIVQSRVNSNGLTPQQLEIMAIGKISLKSLLEPDHIRKIRERRDTPEVKFLAKMDGLKPNYLLGLLTDAAPNHGKVLTRYPEYAIQLTGDLRDILWGS